VPLNKTGFNRILPAPLIFMDWSIGLRPMLVWNVALALLIDSFKKERTAGLAALWTF